MRLCVEIVAADVTLAWNRNPEPDIAGYRLYFTDDLIFEPLELRVPREVGNTNCYTVSNLCAGCTFWFAVTAYNTAGLESNFSEVLEYTVSQATSPFRVTVFVETSATLAGPWQTQTQWTSLLERTNIFLRARLTTDH